MRLYDLESRFTTSEFQCPCGCGFGTTPLDIDKNLVQKLNFIRYEYGKPMVVTSGARCEDYNRKIGGVKDSAHLRGGVMNQCRAADILIRSSEERYTLISLALKYGFTRIGIAPNFIHLDTAGELPQPVIFDY